MKDREEYISILEQDNAELKKQVDELNRFKFSCKKDETQIPATIYNKKTIEDISKIKSQQKEFIKWLEDYLDLFDNMNIGEQASYDMLEEILQKYKSIIGDKQ